MALCRLGTTIVDELRLCYVAEPMLFSALSEIKVGEHIDFDTFFLYRVTAIHFRCAFNVCIPDGKDDFAHIATIRYGRYGDEKSAYMWYKVENWVLYNRKMLQEVLSIPEILGCSFNNITALDVCRDSTKSYSTLIRKLYKDKTNKTIINGKTIKSRKATIPEMFITYSVTLDKLKEPTVCIKQRMAVKDKTQGVSVTAYNKKKEIESASNKNYILDFYDNPASLHRLEVHLNAPDIRIFCNKRNTPQSIDLLFDDEFLDSIFFEHLSSVIRFTKGRKKLLWCDLLSNENH